MARRHTFPGVYVDSGLGRFNVTNNQEPVPTPPIPPITTFTIAGTITEDGTVKVGVPISFTSNFVYTTNGDGIYVATVARNYVGSGTPVFSGGTFTPTSRVYATVISDYANQNFVYNGTGGFGPQPLPEFVYVMGHAYHGQDVPQVPINELPISINGTDAYYTNEDGAYLMQLPYGFTGTIYADDLFGTFSPANYVFYGLTSNQTDKDWLFYVTAPAPGNFLVSGTLFDYSSNLGYYEFTAGWQVDWNQGSTFTDVAGQYGITVPAGYTGTVALFDVWGTSTPASYSLVNVQTNQPNKNFDIYGPDYTTGGTLWNQTTNAPEGFAPVEFDGYPTVFCDASGVYALDLPYSWVGNITAPYIGGGSASPTAYAINGLAADDMSYNFQKYDPPPPPSYLVSGTITDASQGNALMPGVEVVFTSIGTYFTNSVGVYNVLLPELVTFDVIPTPVPEGFGAFTPVSYSYVTLASDQTNQNFSFSEYNACPVGAVNITPLTLAPEIISPSRNAADDTQGLIWTIDDSGPLVVYYDVTYGTVAGFVDTSPGGAFGVAGIVYDPVTNKVVIQDYNYNIQVIDPVTKTVEVVLDGPREPDYHMLCLGSSGTVYASSNRWVVPSPRAEIDVIDLNQTPAVVAARHDQTVSTDSICWATNISRLVVNSGGVGQPRFYLFNPVDGSFQVSVDVNPQNFNYENAYIEATGHLIQGFNSGAAVQIMDIANGANAVVVATLTGNGPPTRASDVTEDTCHARLFVSDGNYAVWEYTLDGNYTLINQYDDAGLGISPTGLSHSRKTNLVYYENYADTTIRSVQATTSGTLTWSFDSTDPDYAYSMAFNSGSFDVVLAGDENGVQGSPGGFLQGNNGFEFNGVLINLAPAYNSEVRVDYTSKIDDQGDLSFSTSTTDLQVMINGVYTNMPVTSQGTVSGSLVPTGVMNYGYNYIQIKGAAYTGGNLLSNPATVFSALNGVVTITAL